MSLFSKSQVLVATPIFVFILFAVSFPFNSNTFATDKPKQFKSVTEEPLSFILRRLVREQDRIQLDETGFACHSDPHSDVCVASKPVILDNKAPKLYIPSHKTEFVRTVRPYPNKQDNGAMSQVTRVEISSSNHTLPACNFSHDVPAFVFSTGGFVGNLFHEFDEIIIPLFITSRHFQSNLKFVITDYKPWMVSKYNRILSRLSHHNVINQEANSSVHCFPGAVIGTKFHGILALNSADIPGGYNMSDFKKFLRDAYDLPLRHVTGATGKTTVLLISRSNSRMFLNEDEMVAMITGLGVEVVITTPYMMSNLDRFAGLVNGCSVMVGAHGAGLTNSVFMAAGAVVVQVVPLGLEWASDAYFGGPVKEMGLKYLEYKVEAEESSLLAKYGKDDPVINDHKSVFLKGYKAARAVYVDGQDLKINLVRFRETMVEAMRLIGRPIPSKMR